MVNEGWRDEIIRTNLARDDARWQAAIDGTPEVRIESTPVPTDDTKQEGSKDKTSTE